MTTLTGHLHCKSGRLPTQHRRRLRITSFTDLWLWKRTVLSSLLDTIVFVIPQPHWRNVIFASYRLFPHRIERSLDGLSSKPWWAKTPILISANVSTCQSSYPAHIVMYQSPLYPSPFLQARIVRGGPIPPQTLFVRSHCRKLRTNKKNTLRRRKMWYDSAHLALFMLYQIIMNYTCKSYFDIIKKKKKKERNTRYYYSGLWLSLNPTPFRKNYIILFGCTCHMLLKLLHIIPQIQFVNAIITHLISHKIMINI